MLILRRDAQGQEGGESRSIADYVSTLALPPISQSDVSAAMKMEEYD